jgi:hypothetical protein
MAEHGYADGTRVEQGIFEVGHCRPGACAVEITEQRWLALDGATMHRVSIRHAAPGTSRELVVTIAEEQLAEGGAFAALGQAVRAAFPNHHAEMYPTPSTPGQVSLTFTLSTDWPVS